MRKTQQKGKNTEQINRTVSFNLLDPDQCADYEYTLNWFNFSGKVKEWIRLCRLGRYQHQGIHPLFHIEHPSMEMGLEFPIFDENDADQSFL